MTGDRALPRPSSTRRRPGKEAARTVVAGRYEIVERVGHGGTADVYRARHLVTGADVALKLFRAVKGSEPSRLRREIAVLRMLRLSGVVELLDEGLHRRRPFLVTTFVRGTFFPGVPRPAAWHTIADRTIAVLETLSQVHAAGIVHRDVKPANVLVDDHGTPTLLDFGIAWTASFAEGLTGDDRILGTPGYLAPEQLRGLPPDARTDLYSFGVMLFEALSGHLPHASATRSGFYAARTGAAPPALRTLAADVPYRVAMSIDRMLAIDPAARPQSAVELLRVLSHSSSERARPASIWLGSRVPVDALVTAARAGRSVTLVGEQGHGKTRCLQEACAALEAEKRRVIWLVPSTYPLDGLEPLLGERPSSWENAPLDDVQRRAAAMVGEALRGGIVLIADDADRLDGASRRVLDGCSAEGAILRTERPALSPPPKPHTVLSALDEEALRDLFEGSDPIFHLREDAARLLFQRTEGVPRNITFELASWERRSLIHSRDDRWCISRHAIERLTETLHADLLLAGSSQPKTVAPQAWQELLTFVGFLWPNATLDALMHVAGGPRYRVEAGLAELEQEGLVRRAGPELFEPCWWRFSLPDWPAAQLLEAHRRAAAALPPGAPGRLFHLVGGAMREESTNEEEILHEMCVRALGLAERGRVGSALVVMSDGIAALIRLLGPARISRGEMFVPAFSLWAELALVEQSIPSADRLLCELLRIQRRVPVLRAIETLLSAAIAFRRGAREGLELAESVPPFDDVRLDRQRQTVRVLAARRFDLAIEERVVEETAAWGERSNHPEARAAGLAFRGRLRYQQGRFAEAGALHEAAARNERLPTLRISAQLNAASALLEAFRHEDTQRLAEEARAEASACRSPFFEMRAEWLVRTARFRRGERMEPNEDLVAAAALLNAPDQLAVICLSEAAIAWHAGLREATARLAARARRIWEEMDICWSAHFAECLEVASGASVSPNRALQLLDAAQRSPVPGAAIQSLALLSMCFAGDKTVISLVRQRWAETDPVTRPLRRDVLSADEALALVEGRSQATWARSQV